MSSTLLKFLYAEPFDERMRQTAEGESRQYPTRADVRSRITYIEELWNKMDEKFGILSCVENLTKRKPHRNLECFIFGAGFTAMSTPFLLPVWNKNNQYWSDEKTIDLIIHELLHIFITADTNVYWQMVENKYSGESRVCRNHLVLYAMLEDIYHELWNKTPLDFERDNLPLGYSRAVELVKENGYKNLISEYQKLVN